MANVGSRDDAPLDSEAEGAYSRSSTTFEYLFPIFAFKMDTVLSSSPVPSAISSYLKLVPVIDGALKD